MIVIASFTRANSSSKVFTSPNTHMGPYTTTNLHKKENCCSLKENYVASKQRSRRKVIRSFHCVYSCPKVDILKWRSGWVKGRSTMISGKALKNGNMIGI